jgi:hypothetical protein
MISPCRIAFATLASIALAGTVLAAQQTTQTAPPKLFVRTSNSSAFMDYVDDVVYGGSVVRDQREAAAGGRHLRKAIPPKSATAWIDLGAAPPWPPSANSVWNFHVWVDAWVTEGSHCWAYVPATRNSQGTRIDVELGDVARFFDAAGKPRPNLCSASRG